VLGSIAELAKETLDMSLSKALATGVAGGTVAFLLVVAATVLLAGPPANPVPPAPAPLVATTRAVAATMTTAAADAASLVREVRAAEQWIDTVKSFRMKVEVAWYPPPAADGAVPSTPPAPERPETLVSAFDDHRLYYRADAREYQLIDHRTWDGKTAVSHSKYDHARRDQEQYTLRSEPSSVGLMVMVNWSWPRTAPHPFWWIERRDPDLEMYGGEPGDFYLAGRETFRGVDCHVVASDLRYRTLYVGVADHRLYGMANRTLPQSTINSRGPIGREIANEMGANVRTSREHNAWLEQLAAEQKTLYWKRFYQRMRPFSRPQVTHWYGDYKEVAPGCWMPMHQGYDLWNIDGDPMAEPVRTKTRDIRVVEVTINPRLPDDLFVWEFDEGVEVADARADTMLLYKHKKHFEPAEWQAILDDAAQRKAKFRPREQFTSPRMSHLDPLGHPMPEFPANAAWVNGGPVTRAELKGKVVVVDCLASWSKFSTEDLAKLNEVHTNGKDGIVVIGLHAPNTPVEDVRRWAAKHGVKFPICVDVAVGKGAWEGTLFNAYGVTDVPSAYMVDRSGKVRSVGSPAGAIDGARRATTQPANAPAGAPR
jgi:hypothetical protein